MSWSRSRAEGRIRGFAAETPEVTVEGYEQYAARRADVRETARLAGLAPRPVLFDLSRDTAVLVDTVQVYVRLLNYDDVRLERGQETEASHARGLALLHSLYGAADRVVEDAGAQRVDFHGARLHAVVIEPFGRASTGARVAAALAIAEQMIDLARSGGRHFLSDPDLQLRFRVGIDLGPCVAIDSGRRDEREPVFIGPAANHAAKLAMGDQEGIYLSDRVREVFAMQRKATLDEERENAASTDELAILRALSVAREGASSRLDDWLADIRRGRSSMTRPTDFDFHQHTPPLRSIDYSALSPSRSIRMPLAAIFADLDRYTAYIDQCMASGGIGEAVRLLHVLRSEFNEVVQKDFGGRKVRFIGDCILGILAEGDARDVDPAATVRQAALCAGGLRSSFDLCGQILPESRKLGLAIGFELGPTPVSRIGIRGDRSVRVASSLAIRESEACQRDCDGRQTKIGPKAYAAADAAVRKLFQPTRTANDLAYDDVAIQTNPRGVTAAISGTAASALSPPPARAYGDR